mmetsp:Transcript_4078/g.6016  ORF Transcript_4078/g.6016 Transcript_4078/m.6016 type:complete len:425 (+) Transcript_4078:33-1307(+)
MKMVVKQRKGKSKGNKDSSSSKVRIAENYNADKDSRGKKSKSAVAPKRKKKLSLPQLFLFLTCFFSVVGGILYRYYLKYGISIFVGRSFGDYKLTPYEWRKYIDDNDKTVLLIGGPHRSGTTIVWEAIKKHPEISGFGDRFETGVDYSEGVLFQELYPRFGVGLEFKKNFGRPKRAKGEDEETQDGLGRFALLPEDIVHWTKENKSKYLKDPSNFSHLMNRFAPYWDKNSDFGGKDGMEKSKIWVEKSPQNGVLTTFLEGIYNMPVQEDGSVDIITPAKTKTCTQFLYMTRHPIANVYAIETFVHDSMGGFIDFEILLRNYIQLHKYMKMDEKALDSPAMWSRLEDFTSSPKQQLKEIYSFLHVSSDESIIDQVIENLDDIKPYPNEKYFKKWCAEGRKEHGHLIEKYSVELKNLELGYDLDVC